MFNETTKRPDPGQCWVCHRRDSVPEDRRDRMPAVCSSRCLTGWTSQHRIVPDSPATHVVAGDEWVPVEDVLSRATHRPNEISEPVTAKSRVVPVGPPAPPFPKMTEGGGDDATPAVDLAVAEASPPVVPVAAAEVEPPRRSTDRPRPVPGAWLRGVLDRVLR